MNVVEQVIALWARLYPVRSYTSGLSTELTHPGAETPEFVQSAFAEIDALEDKLQGITDPDQRFTAQRLLVSFRTSLRFPQPSQGIHTCGDGAFYILLKGDQQAPWVATYLESVSEVIAFETRRWKDEHFSLEIKKTCLNSADYLTACADSIRKQNLHGPTIQAACKRLRSQVGKYKALFRAPGLETQDVTALLALFATQDQAPHRTPGYPEVLADLYNLSSDASTVAPTIKKRAQQWLAQDMVIVSQLTQEIAPQLGSPHDIGTQALWDAIGVRYAVPDVMPLAHQVATVCNEFAAVHLLDFSSSETVLLQETPSYMTPLITGGQDLAIDYLTDQPKSHLYLTPEKNTSLLTMLNILVHEFSHGFNFVSSARYAPPLLNLDTPLQVAMTEGMALYREFEYYQAAADLLDQPDRDSVEEAYLNLYGATTEEQTLAIQCARLETYLWRIARYLRAIFDVDVHMGEKTYMQFLDWANSTTGLSREFIHGECFSFLSKPGYAPCYAIPGRVFEDAQQFGLRHAVSSMAFNTDASKMGFYPWSLGEGKLWELARNRSVVKLYQTRVGCCDSPATKRYQ